MKSSFMSEVHSNKGLAMRLKTSESSFKFNFLLVKCSGFIFYSIERVGNQLVFKRSLLDAIWWILNLAFSFEAFSRSQKRSFNETLQSQILSKGVAGLYRFFMLSIIYTKSYNFFMQVKAFEFTKALFWIEQKVRNLFHLY